MSNLKARDVEMEIEWARDQIKDRTIYAVIDDLGDNWLKVHIELDEDRELALRMTGHIDLVYAAVVGFVQNEIDR